MIPNPTIICLCTIGGALCCVLLMLLIILVAEKIHAQSCVRAVPRTELEELKAIIASNYRTISENTSGIYDRVKEIKGYAIDVYMKADKLAADTESKDTQYQSLQQ